MKILKVKSILFSLLAILTLSVFLTSCRKILEEVQPVTQELTFEQKTSVFKANFPEEYSNISLNNIQEVESSLTNANTIENGITVPIEENNQIIGRYIGLTDQSASVYLDFSDYENTVRVYNVNNPSQFEDFQMAYNYNTNNYEPIRANGGGGFWCEVGCVLSAITISGLDGPFPFMDILAVAYEVACIADCADK